MRSVPGGGYIVAHEADGKVREYDRQGSDGPGRRGCLATDLRHCCRVSTRRHAVLHTMNVCIEIVLRFEDFKTAVARDLLHPAEQPGLFFG